MPRAITAAPAPATTTPATAAHTLARPACLTLATCPVRATSGEMRVALRAGRRTAMRVTSVPRAMVRASDTGEMVS